MSKLEISGWGDLIAARGEFKLSFSKEATLSRPALTLLDATVREAPLDR